MHCAVAHGVHRDFHAASFNAADHRHIETELADQGLHLAQQIRAVAQTNDHDMCAFASAKVKSPKVLMALRAMPGLSLTQLGTLTHHQAG
jgi:hypothetical protein